MNDIEVLEKELRNINNLIEYYTFENLDYDKKYRMEDFKKAIENLLKERQSDKERIKDLEEINEAHKKENGELREELESIKEIYYTQKEIETYYIPKSLIKEKKKEIREKSEMCNSIELLIYAEIDKILEELLKGE